MLDATDALLRQIRLGEDSALELKTVTFNNGGVSGPHADAMADELAAMANTANGVFVLGVDDKTKAVVGIAEDKLDVVETWLRDLCNDKIKPPLAYTMRKIALTIADGGQRAVIKIDVPRSLFVHESPHGYFHRAGSSKRKLGPEALARLFQQRSQTRLIRFDEQPVAGADKSCLAKALWEKFKTPRSSDSDEGFLLKLKLLGRDQDGATRPTVSGILMACEQPRRFLPNAYIQAVAYRRSERNAAHQYDVQDIAGPLDAQVYNACRFVEKNMNVYAVKQPARRDIPQYAMQAVFEAIVNAVAHRDYSIYGAKIRLFMFPDRLELRSPGGLPNTMTIQSLAELQSSRNELLASLLAKCPMPHADIPSERVFLMDKRGEGVPIIYAESERLCGRRPFYRLIDNAELLLTIFAAPPPWE